MHVGAAQLSPMGPRKVPSGHVFNSDAHVPPALLHVTNEQRLDASLHLTARSESPQHSSAEHHKDSSSEDGSGGQRKGQPLPPRCASDPSQHRAKPAGQAEEEEAETRREPAEDTARDPAEESTPPFTCETRGEHKRGIG